MAVGALALTALPAQADPTPIDPHTSVFVTQLGLTDGHGRLTLQAHIGSDRMVGFEADIPAGDGRWIAAQDVDVPELGVHCIGGPGPALHYLCGATGAAASTPLPTGNFQLAVPVVRIGSAAGLWGSTTVDRLTSYNEGYATQADTFPVVDAATHARSTAEATSLDTRWVRGAGVLSETITVRPGESVWAVDTTLPAGDGVSWVLNQWTVPSGLYCHLQPADDGTATVHCVEWAAGLVAIPAGRFTIALHLTAGVDDGSATPATISLTVGDSPAEVQDTFPWRGDLTDF